MNFFNIACLKEDGTRPEDNDKLTMVKILGPNVGKASLKRAVGRISWGLDDHFIDLTKPN